MKKNINSVDEFFRDSLQDHKVTPSEAARSRFLDEAAATGSSGRSNFLRWYNILAVAVVITASIFLFSVFSKDNAPASGKTEGKPLVGDTRIADQNLVPAKPDNQSIQTRLNSTAPSNTVDNSSRGIKNQGPLLATKRNLYTNTTVNTSTKEKGAVENIKLVSVQQNVLTTAEVSEESAEAKVKQTEELAAITDTTLTILPNTNEYPQPFQDVISSNPPSAMDQTEGLPNPEQMPSPFILTPFLAYSLDWNPKSSGNGLTHSLTIEGKMQYRRFSFTTGAGIATTTAFNNYEVLYNDYLGNYSKLDSITFAYDEKRYNLVPSYYMSDVMVWDSSVKLDSYQEENRYNHLRVPVLLGYDIIAWGKFTAGIRAGTEIFFYLGSNTVSREEYNSGQNKVVSVNANNDELMRTNIWFMASFSAAYYLSKRIVIEIEPHMKYLLNPSPSGSFGANQEVIPALRTSLKIKF